MTWIFIFLNIFLLILLFSFLWIYISIHVRGNVTNSSSSQHSKFLRLILSCLTQQLIQIWHMWASVFRKLSLATSTNHQRYDLCSPGSASGSPLRWACLITQWAGAATLFWAYFNQCQPSHPGEKAHDDEGQNQDRPISIITGPALVQSWFNLWTNGEPLLFPQLFRSHIITSLYTLFL